MYAHKKAADSPVQGTAARKTHYTANGIDQIPKRQSRLPAYGRDFLELRRSGRSVPYLLIVIGWHAGKAMPRVVVPDDIDPAELDLHFVRGIECMVVHRDEPVRAFDVAEHALTAGATRCPVYDMHRGRLDATTDEVMLARGMEAAA